MSEQSVRFCVADTGPGIPDEEREYLFERFWQASDLDRRGDRGGARRADLVFHFEMTRGSPSYLQQPAQPGA